MKIFEIDVATRVFNLSLEIKYLVQTYDLSKRVIIEDFTDLIMADFEEKEDEDS